MSDISRFESGAPEKAPEEFAQLAEALPHLVWSTDAAGRVLYVNERFREYTGWDATELEAQPGRKFIVHEDDLDASLRAWETARATGEPYQLEYRLRRASDHSFRWFLARARPLRDASGEIVRWVGTATDIDDRRRADDNLRFTVAAYGLLYTLESVDEVCRRLVEVAIAHIADWGFVALLNDDDASYRVGAIDHRDKQFGDELARYSQEFPPQAGGAMDKAVRSNTGIVIPRVSEEQLQMAAKNETQRQLLERLQMHSVMIAPIVGERGREYGALVVSSSSSGRAYASTDLEVLESIARRAGKSIDNALLLEYERRSANEARFLAALSEVLFSAFEVAPMLGRFVEHVTPRYADAAIVFVRDSEDALRIAAVYGGEGAEQYIGARPFRPEIEARALTTLARGEAFITPTISRALIDSHVWEYVSPLLEPLEGASSVTIPLRVRGTVYGAAVLYRFSGSVPYVLNDLPLFSDIGRRLQSAVAQADTLERERRISSELQRALLPNPHMLPKPDNMAFSVVYRPSMREAEVGGDWYDAFPLPDGSIAISVGDITGRGLRAAGLMGKLRQALGVIPLYESDPAKILDAVDLLLRARGSSAMATAFLGIISPDGRSMRFANAGHPYPVLRRHGRVTYLTSEGLPLGLRDQAPGSSREVSLDGAEVLVLYTDGLIESTHDIIEGEARLAAAVLSDAIAFSRNAADLVASTCLDGTYLDDAAVLAINFGTAKRWAFDAENAQVAQGARAQLLQYLRAEQADGDFDAAELIFGELVGNVVRHAPGPIEVQVQWKGATPRLHVIDRGKGFRAAIGAPSDLLKESGRGLFLVNALGKNITIEHIARYGTHIAVDLPLTRAMSAA